MIQEVTKVLRRSHPHRSLDYQFCPDALAAKSQSDHGDLRTEPIVPLTRTRINTQLLDGIVHSLHRFHVLFKMDEHPTEDIVKDRFDEIASEASTSNEATVVLELARKEMRKLFNHLEQ